MDIVKLISIAAIVSVTIVITKQIKPELSVVLVIAGSVIMLSYIILGLTDVLGFFNQIIVASKINTELFAIIIKIIAAGYLIEFAYDICIDSGNTAIADKVLLGGKVIIFIMSMPIISELFYVVINLVEM